MLLVWIWGKHANRWHLYPCIKPHLLSKVGVLSLIPPPNGLWSCPINIFYTWIFVSIMLPPIWTLNVVRINCCIGWVNVYLGMHPFLILSLWQLFLEGNNYCPWKVVNNPLKSGYFEPFLRGCHLGDYHLGLLFLGYQHCYSFFHLESSTNGNHLSIWLC
jgi:hypothetical protein